MRNNLPPAPEKRDGVSRKKKGPDVPKPELQRKVSELERKGREDEKKLETLKAQLESTAREKEGLRAKLESS